MPPTRAPKRARSQPLSGAGIPAPVKWRAVTLAKDDSAGAVFSSTGCALLAQLRANESGALAGQDPEYLHQLRVTVRRLRAILSLYSELLRGRERKSAARELKWLAFALGPARDSDVFIHDIWPPLHELLGHGALVEALNAEWLAQRRRNTRIAHRALTSRRYQRMMHELEAWFSAQSWRAHANRSERAAWDQHAQKFARHELECRAERVRSHGHVLGDMDAAALHRLRIKIKKLRYVMDTVSPLFKHTKVQEMLESLSNLQDTLGAMHDVAVAVQKIGEALPKVKRIDTGQLRRQIAAWQALRSKILKRKLNPAWHTFRHAKPFW